MSEIKPIRNRGDYDDAIELLSSLISSGTNESQESGTKIKLLAKLISDYESLNLADYVVDPIEAIKLRIDQLGMKQSDLVDYFGARSRVSEVLSGKRALTIDMIRKLEKGLDIPANILIGADLTKGNRRWSPKTIKIMAMRGYFGPSNTKADPKKIISMGLLRDFFSDQRVLQPSLLRQANYRDINKIDSYHMQAWTGKLFSEARRIITEKNVSSFSKNNISEESIRKLFRLSAKPNGALTVIEKLLDLGIVIVIEPHLPSTRLDGAMLKLDNNIVIGLTLRYDRLDSFWFTLAHELAHAILHSEESIFYDQLFSEPGEITELEDEADDLAGRLLIPDIDWRQSTLRYASTPTLIKMFAQKVGVHESVVAGRIRHETGEWTTHGDMVNPFKVRHMFEGVVWEI